jgi:hypothetical protein
MLVERETMRLKPRDLAEVREEVDQIDKKMVRKDNECKEVKIDKKIRDLIIGLRRWNIDTKESCEGHRIPGGFRTRFPYVVCPKENEMLVRRILETYKNSDKWTIDDIKSDKNFVLQPKLLEGEDGLIFTPRLSAYQKEVKLFGKWLQEIPDDFFSK